MGKVYSIQFKYFIDIGINADTLVIITHTLLYYKT